MTVGELIQRLAAGYSLDAEVWINSRGHTAIATIVKPTNVIKLNCSPSGRPRNLVIIEGHSSI